jgi:hypothetical protein
VASAPLATILSALIAVRYLFTELAEHSPSPGSQNAIGLVGFHSQTLGRHASPEAPREAGGPLSFEARAPAVGKGKAGDLGRLVALYARSLAEQDYDVERHPSFHDYACGVMASGLFPLSAARRRSDATNTGPSTHPARTIPLSQFRSMPGAGDEHQDVHSGQ